MCVKLDELGRPFVAEAFPAVFLARYGAFCEFPPRLFDTRDRGRGREEVEGMRGFGVVLWSPLGVRILLGGGCIGVLMALNGFLALAEESEMGGEGGVGVSETLPTVDIDFVSGGVSAIGDEAVEFGE